MTKLNDSKQTQQILPVKKDAAAFTATNRENYASIEQTTKHLAGAITSNKEQPFINSIERLVG